MTPAARCIVNASESSCAGRSVLHGRPDARPCGPTRPSLIRQDGSRHRTATVCHAVEPSAALATYPFPSQLQRHGGSMFTRSFRELILHLSDQPLVQLSYSSSVVWHERHLLESAQASEAELWAELQSHASLTSPDMLMFVRPVADSSDLCAKVGAEPTTCSDAKCLSFAPQDTSSSLAGKVGDCCDEDDDAHASEVFAQRVLDSPDMEVDADYLNAHGLHVQYYGLVSQSAGREASDGCYLIKTVRQLEAAGCHCMHYSLMRVCQGASLQRQALEHWL